jgi:hypothetical protein
VGTLATFFARQTARNLWDSAGESQLEGNPWVYTVNFDRFIQYPKQMTVERIKEELDTFGADADIFKPPSEEYNFLDETPVQGNVVYVYQPVSKTTPSILYSRKAILHAEAEGELPPKVRTALTTLRANYQFPSPVSEPVSTWSSPAGLSLGGTLVPWLIFFLVRWVVQGFRTDNKSK